MGPHSPRCSEYVHCPRSPWRQYPTLGVARLANVYGGWAVATLWNPPDQRNVLGILGYGSLGMSIKAGSNVFREFWPDVKKRLKH